MIDRYKTFPTKSFALLSNQLNTLKWILHAQFHYLLNFNSYFVRFNYELWIEWPVTIFNTEQIDKSNWHRHSVTLTNNRYKTAQILPSRPIFSHLFFSTPIRVCISLLQSWPKLALISSEPHLNLVFWQVYFRCCYFYYLVRC